VGSDLRLASTWIRCVAAVALLAGTGLGSLIAAGFVYAGFVLIVERIAFPSDAAMLKLPCSDAARRSRCSATQAELPSCCHQTSVASSEYSAVPAAHAPPAWRAMARSSLRASTIARV
jgi:hypothetical protein